MNCSRTALLVIPRQAEQRGNRPLLVWAIRIEYTMGVPSGAQSLVLQFTLLL